LLPAALSPRSLPISVSVTRRSRAGAARS
jgi:hypothetical protein